jgi:LPS export ABC transporter permease LptG
MKLLTRYILATFAKILALVLPVMVALYLVVECVERIDDFVEQQAGADVIALYVVLRAPVVAVQVASMAVLLAAALTIMLLERSRELIAFLAAGASPWHLFYPFLLGGVVLAGLGLAAEEYILPGAHRGLMALPKNHRQTRPQGVLVQQGEIWLRTPEGAFVHIELIDPGGERVHGITMYRKDGAGDLLEQVEAREAVWLANRWTLFHGALSRFRNNLTTEVEPFTRLDMAIGIEPEALRSMFRPPAQMSPSELRSYMRKLRDRGIDMVTYARDFQAKLTTPAMSVVMAVVGLAAMWGTHGARSLGLGFAGTLGAAALYWLLVLAGTTVSDSHHAALLAGIWVPHLLVFGVGVGILWYKARL